MFKKIIIIAFLVLLIVLGKFIVSTLNFSPVVFQYFFNHNIELKQTNSTINLLLLGIGGGTHDGPNLSDTIIFSSIDLKNNRITILSIPRDLWVPDLRGKINTAYAIGEQKKKGGGITLARAVVGKIVNQPIDYVVVVNFDGFVKAVDLVGGLDITVDHTLDDKNYPIEGKENDLCGHTPEDITAFTATASAEMDFWNFFPCRYEHLYIPAGKQHLDGKTALQFVRSRHAIGEEGTDFARSRRQEKVIAAFKDKLFSAETFLNPLKIVSLYTTLSENINTDINKNEIDDFIKLAQKMKNAKIQSFVLDYGDVQQGRPGLLVNPPISSEYGNQWVLIPRTGNNNFSEIQKYDICIEKNDNCAITKEPAP